MSDTCSVSSGVPQGSILGPLLFITFFNDIKDNISKCDVFQYADDTVLLFADKNIQNIEDTLNMDMKSVGSYCDQNELLLNLKKGKTEVMLFGTSQRLKRHGRELNIVHNNTRINFVTEYVYLGNLLDNHLSLASNFNRAIRKASGRLRILSNVRKSLTIEAAVLIYKMMILPIITYSSTIKTCFTETQRRKFSSIERRAERIVGKPVRPIVTVMEQQVCSLVMKCLSKELCHKTLDKYFEKQKHNKRTRNNNLCLKLPALKLEIARSSFYFGGAKVFNNLSLRERRSVLQ